MNRIVEHAIIILLCSGLWASFVSAGDAILPQGDPRLQEPGPAEQARREEIRKNRLKQQGQGENYRVEGELQGGTGGSTQNDSPGTGRQDTGIADPTVNPGQAAGTRNIQGRIIQSDERTYRVRQNSGEEVVLVVDDDSRGDTDLHPGDFITGKVTHQGRAVIVKKGFNGSENQEQASEETP